MKWKKKKKGQRFLRSVIINLLRIFNGWMSWKSRIIIVTYWNSDALVFAFFFFSSQSEFSKCISGVILHHETVYEKTTDGIDMIELLRQRNVVPGIKVDKGLVPLFGAKNENTTEGLDNLQERCIQYKRDGCHFAKWRCTFSITETTPSQLAMVTNADVLARFIIS